MKIYIKLSYVEDDGELREYTEYAHIAHTRDEHYVPHKERYEDSKLVVRIENPVIKREVNS